MPILPPWTFPVLKPWEQAPSPQVSTPPEAAVPSPDNASPEVMEKPVVNNLDRLRQALGQASYAVDPVPPPDSSDPKRMQQALHQAAQGRQVYERQFGTPNRNVDLARTYAWHLQAYAAKLSASPQSMAPLGLNNLALSRRQLRLYYRTAGGRPQVTALTPGNAKDLFSRLNIPYSPELTPDLLRDLTDTLSQMEYGIWERTLQQVLQTAPEAAEPFRALRTTSFWFDGHLIWSAGVSGAAIMTCLTRHCYPDLRSTLRQENGTLYRFCFQSLAKDRRQQARDSLVLPTDPLFPNKELTEITHGHLLFLRGQTGYLVWFDRDKKALTCQRAPDIQYPHTQKYLPMPPAFLPEGGLYTVSRTLYLLTGGVPEAVDETAAFLSRLAAAGPGKRQLSVILTNQNTQALRQFLTKLFDGKVLAPELEGQGLSSLLKGRSSTAPRSSGIIGPKDGRARLLQAQISGAYLLFPDQRLPSPGKEGLFRDLIEGRRLTVPDTLLPGQSFHNQMHLVYLTGDQGFADRLVQRFNAYRLDLRPHELPCPPEGFSANRGELQWLRGILLPWGLTLQRKRVFRSSGKAGDPLEAFLSLQCRVSPELRTGRQEVYEAYQAFYRTRCGRDCPETAVRFGKRLRAAMAKEKSFRSVTYKVARYGDDQLGLCYVGLGLRPDCKAEAGGNADTYPEAYLSHLRMIADTVGAIYKV